MTNDTQDFDVAKIRELLLAAFTAPEDLERFCRDRPIFKLICLEFSQAMGLNDMVDEVIKYCDAQLLFYQLLEQVAVENPRQYARFQPDLGSSAPPIPPLPIIETRAAAPPTPAEPGRRLAYWIGGGVLLLAIAGLAIALLWKPAPRDSFQIVFDRSEAMNAPFDNQFTKIEMAKQEIPKVLYRLPYVEDDYLALRLFGGTCSPAEADTTELVVPFGRNNLEEVETQLDVVETRGQGTLHGAIKPAIEDFGRLKRSEGAVKTLIIITGSDEFCLPDEIEAIGESLKGTDINIRVRLIGIALSEDQQNGLQTLAEETGGSFYPVSDLAGFGDALASAFEIVTPAPTDTLTPGPTNTFTPGPTSTPTPTPTSTPTPTPTNTFTPTPTNTFTPTPTNTFTPTPTNTFTPTPTNTFTPTPTNTPTITPIPTLYPAPTLLLPVSDATVFDRFCFSWQGDGRPLPQNLAFDLRIWSAVQEEWRDARGVDKPTRETQLCVDLPFVPAIWAYGEGDYYWTVLVVKTGTGSPKAVGEPATERRFTYKVRK